MRGGSWNNNPQNIRVSNRNRNEPTKRNNNIGFRCAGYAEPGPGVVRTRGREPVSSTENLGVPPPLPGCDPDVRVDQLTSNIKATRGFLVAPQANVNPGYLSSRFPYARQPPPHPSLRAPPRPPKAVTTILKSPSHTF